MRDVAAFKNLSDLGLSDTSVTDLGLKELAGLKNLNSLYARHTGMTDAGVAEFRKARPDCYVIR